MHLNKNSTLLHMHILRNIWHTKCMQATLTNWRISLTYNQSAVDISGVSAATLQVTQSSMARSCS